MDEKMKNILAGAIIGFGVSYVVLDNMAARDSVMEATPPSVEEAAAFLADVETEISEFGEYASRVFWVQANFMTEDTTALAAAAGERGGAMALRIRGAARRFKDLEMPADMRRKIDGILSDAVTPSPDDADKNAELAQITAGLDATYGLGKYCPSEDTCYSDVDLIQIMATSRDPDELLDAWQGWRTISPPMRDDYARMVEISNEGARELGFADTGELWRGAYDMEPNEFRAEADRLWGQVKPLYDSLHCFVRDRLIDQYGDVAVGAGGMIPAHLTGNMWAQNWGNIMPIVADEGADPGYDLTQLLEGNGYDALRLVETGEGFFTGLGFEPLPDTFWERSLFLKPRDRNVQCHASAWDIDSKEDVRIKMCIDITADDFTTVHHELGHNFYQRAYMNQSPLFQDGAHDGFHEAIGDFIALSITPGYLKDIGLLQNEPDASRDVGLLLQRALDGVAFLPFGLMVDQWRWGVFAGEITPDNYNAAWWQLREKYQGITPPIERTEANFDPGAKYHIPGSVPYMRYFLAAILQYQFHQAGCQMAGWEGPLHRCSINGNKEVGARLNAMLEMGSSRPWPDALEAFTGTRQMDGSAILAYYAPLKAWLDEQNAGKACGWTPSNG
jgi:peptidyl-dipeptidase A